MLSDGLRRRKTRARSGACTTYQVWFRELEAFERDLHVHVHLENNILFPKARALENRENRENH